MRVLNKISNEFKEKLEKILWRKIECEPDYDGRMVFFTGITRRRYIDTFYIAKSAIYYQFSKRMREYGVGNLTMWIGLGNNNFNRVGMYWLDVRPENEKYLVTYYQKIEYLYKNDMAFMPGALGIDEFTLEPGVNDCLCPCIEFSGRYEDLTGYPEDDARHEFEENLRLRGERNQQENQTLLQDLVARLRERDQQGEVGDMEEFERAWANISTNFAAGSYNITFSESGIEEIVRNEDPPINSQETFKSDACVLCLDENVKPNVMFCSCGHICICDSCNNSYNKKECPICKVVSNIKRKI